MNAVRTAWEALNEKCDRDFLIVSWCFFILVVVIEITLPVAFGYAIDNSGIAQNTMLVISTKCFYIYDKLGMLLGLFCVTSTYTNVRSWSDEKNDPS